MVTPTDMNIAVNGFSFMIALTAKDKFASQPFKEHTRFDLGFIY
jgi:hypothetical protein